GVCFEIGCVRQAGKDTQVGFTLCQGPNNVQAGLFFQLQGNSRVQTSKLAQWLGQKLRNSRCVGQDMHQALLALRERLEARFDLLRAIEQCARAVQQFQACCGRADTFVRTQQQGRSEEHTSELQSRE